MKRTLIAMGIFLIAMTIRLYANDDDIVHIPDTSFKAQLVNYHHQNLECPKIDLNEDGEIQVSEAKAFYGKLELDGTDIYDLTGIEAFKNLWWFDLYQINMEYLDLSEMKKLQIFYCHDSKTLQKISLANCIKLIRVAIRRNFQLEEIDVKGCSNLVSFSCYDCKLNRLDVSSCISLESIGCSKNSLKTLDLSNNEKLGSIGVRNNDISAFDLSHNKELEILGIGNNKLTELNCKNGNNHLIKTFVVNSNPDLKCITVDDPTYVYANWFSDSTHYKFDKGVGFSEDCNSSINEINSNFRIYPNPVSTKMNIIRENTNETVIQVFNLNGQLCLSHLLKSGQTECQMDVSKLSTGIYFLEMNNKKIKFIKE